MDFYYGIIIGMATLLFGQALGFITYYFAAGKSSRLVNLFNPDAGDSQAIPGSPAQGMGYTDEPTLDEDTPGEKAEAPPTEHSVGIPFR